MTEKVAKHFLQALQEKKDVNALSAILGTASRSELLQWTDENGLNLLHHCILNDDAEAIDCLLRRGYFAKPSKPVVSPYMHLAALLGFINVLAVLVQHRPDDFQVTPYPLNLPAHVAQRLVRRRNYAFSKKSGSWRSKQNSMTESTRKSSAVIAAEKRTSSQSSNVDGPEGWKKRLNVLEGGICLDGSQPLNMTPLEVAAHMLRLQCVRLLLDLCVQKANPHIPNKGHFSLAAVADCPPALSLLLMADAIYDIPQLEDMKGAIRLSVQKVQPQCLDLLLSNIPNHLDIKSVFRNINFYHVLFSLSASYGQEVCERLPEVTRVLIRKEHDVNATEPPRTYPMYTLLSHAFYYHDHTFDSFYLDCLKVLLKAGADPNHDEVEFEMQLNKQQGLKFSAGRNAFSSGMSCLLEAMENNMGHFPQSDRVSIVLQFTDTLVRHGAKLCKVGRIQARESGDLYGHVLHQFAKSAVTLGLDKDVLRGLVTYGADPGLKVQDKYAINVYFDKLFELLLDPETSDFNRRYKEDVISAVALFCRFMPPAAINQAAFILKKTYVRTESEKVKAYLLPALTDLESRSRQVWPLKKGAAWRVWKLCDKKVDNVLHLPVTQDLKTSIVPFGG